MNGKGGFMRDDYLAFYKTDMNSVTRLQIFYENQRKSPVKSEKASKLVI